MSERAIFSPTLLAAFVTVAVGGFALSLYLSPGNQDTIDSLGPNAYSRSAVGYEGIAALMPELGAEVIKSAKDSQQKAKDGLLILAEPRSQAALSPAFKKLLLSNKVLVILPKWYGVRDRVNAGWVESLVTRSTGDVKEVLDQVFAGGEVVRTDKASSWPANAIGVEPSVAAPVQLVKSAALQPLVSSGEGILLGEIMLGKRRIWVLSDPDVLSNQGLGPDGKRNAVFAVQLLRKLGGGGKIVFDESIHGYISSPAPPWRFIFQFPFVIVTLQAVAAIGLLLWATTGRFGPPAADAPELGAGKHALIDNVARLMAFAGHQRTMVRRYVETAIRDVAQQLHAPKGLSEGELLSWLARAGEARGVSVTPGDVLERAEALTKGGGHGLSSAARITKDIYQWKGEMLNGPARHPDSY